MFQIHWHFDACNVWARRVRAFEKQQNLVQVLLCVALLEFMTYMQLFSAEGGIILFLHL